MANPNKNKIPNTKIHRLGIIGKTALKVGAKEVSHQLTKNFKSQEKKQTAKKNKDEEIAKEIFKALSNMKGLAIKFAQFLNLENYDLLSPAFQKELNKANYINPIQQAFRYLVETAAAPYLNTD